MYYLGHFRAVEGRVTTTCVTDRCDTREEAEGVLVKIAEIHKGANVIESKVFEYED